MIKENLLAFEKVILCVVRKWWRPITCLWIAATMAVHGVIVPLFQLITKGEVSTDLTGLSLLVTSIASAFAVREWGKVKGVSNDS
jgi:hypothetical protein